MTSPSSSRPPSRRARASRTGATAAVLLSFMVGCPTGYPTWEELRETGFDSLAPFADDAALHAHLRQVAELQPRGFGGLFGCAAGESAPQSAAADGAGAESITNNQEEGVDEGGIVKAAGELLVVLRRGRLFTVRVGDDVSELSALSAVDVTPPGAQHGAWYDEMLLHTPAGGPGLVVVLGYSYELGASELGVFSLEDDGQLAHVTTRYLRSNDYYSSRNYATRLIDGQLVIYTPHYDFFRCADLGCEQVDTSLPATGVLGPDGQVEWTEIAGGADVTRPIQPSTYPVLHTVTQCDLTAEEMPCAARAVIGPWARSFYVTGDAVYLWVHGEPRRDTAEEEQPDTVLYRLPLLEGPVTAVTARGAPVDQFSFKATDEAMNVLVVTDGGGGDAMWEAEQQRDQRVELLRFPLSAFATDAPALDEALYRELPAVAGWSIVNRFVGTHLLYGEGSPWGGPDDDSATHRVFVVDSASDAPVTTVPLVHRPDRIEALGAHALVVGAAGEDLVFSSVALDGDPRVASERALTGATQGETRSHAFFFRPRQDGGGTLGLPVRHQGEAADHLWSGSAEVLFLDVATDLSLSPLGALASSSEAQRDDACRVSCTDWYGNARPIFYRGRVFALLGYELVEGALGDESLDELGRVTMLDVLSP